MESKNTLPPIIDQVKEYAETRFKLLKYEAIERGSSVAANIITDVVIVISLVLTFLFASFTLALFLAHIIGSYWAGFGCVALLYLLIAIIIMAAKSSFETPLINFFIKKLFNHKK